ncbi:MAG TPA: alpha/beta fold hydrolase [Kofleriaceae bacterium]
MRVARAALHAAFAVSDDLGASLAERMFVTPRSFARPERERGYLATARPFSVDVSLRSPGKRARTQLAAWRWGFGPAVLLVHGWEGRGTQLGAFVQPLVEAGFSVVAFDAPAHGDSPGQRTYLTDLADSIGDVAAAVGPLHAIIAHSFGCAGVMLSRVHADRLIFVAPNALVEDSPARFAKFLGLDGGEQAALEARLVAHTGVPFEMLALDKLVGDAPLLILHDADDREVPLGQGTRLAATWPGGARLVTTHALGHRRILRDPAVLAAAVSFAKEGMSLPVSDLVREVDRHLDRSPL